MQEANWYQESAHFLYLAQKVIDNNFDKSHQED